MPIPQPSSNLVIDFADEDSSFDEGSEVEVVPTPKAVSATPLPAIDAGISNLFAEVKSAQPDTAQKMQQMTKLREMIAQKERELEEKRKSKQGKGTPAAAPEAVAVVPKRNPVPAKKPALPVAPTVQDTVTSASKRQKTADTATPSAPVVNLDKVSAQVTEVFKKEEDLRQQLQQLEAAQSELLSLQRSILACKSEKSHLESRVKILQDHLKQAQQQLTQIVAKEQTLISKQNVAEKKVNDKRRAIKAAGGSLSLQRMQLKDTEIELDVKVAVESAARPAATANPTGMSIRFLPPWYLRISMKVLIDSSRRDVTQIWTLFTTRLCSRRVLLSKLRCAASMSHRPVREATRNHCCAPASSPKLVSDPASQPSDFWPLLLVQLGMLPKIKRCWKTRVA